METDEFGRCRSVGLLILRSIYPHWLPFESHLLNEQAAVNALRMATQT